MGAKSKSKGRRGELELTAELHRLGYDTVKAGVCTFYGEEPDVSGLPGVHVECKRTERLDLTGAMQQATRDSDRFKDGYPAVFSRKNRQEWYVTMRLEDWTRMHKAAIKKAE